MGMGHESRLRSSHLGSHRPLTLQFSLVPVESLLSAILQIRAVVVLWETVLHGRVKENAHQSDMDYTMHDWDTHRTAELGTTVWAFANNAKRCGVALAVGADLGLAAFLGRHDRMRVARAREGL